MRKERVVPHVLRAVLVLTVQVMGICHAEESLFSPLHWPMAAHVLKSEYIIQVSADLPSLSRASRYSAKLDAGQFGLPVDNNLLRPGAINRLHTTPYFLKRMLTDSHWHIEAERWTYSVAGLSWHAIVRWKGNYNVFSGADGAAHLRGPTHRNVVFRKTDWLSYQQDLNGSCSALWTHFVGGDDGLRTEISWKAERMYGVAHDTRSRQPSLDELKEISPWLYSQLPDALRSRLFASHGFRSISIFAFSDDSSHFIEVDHGAVLIHGLHKLFPEGSFTVQRVQTWGACSFVGPAHENQVLQTGKTRFRIQTSWNYDPNAQVPQLSNRAVAQQEVPHPQMPRRMVAADHIKVLCSIAGLSVQSARQRDEDVTPPVLRTMASIGHRILAESWSLSRFRPIISWRAFLTSDFSAPVSAGPRGGQPIVDRRATRFGNASYSAKTRWWSRTAVTAEEPGTQLHWSLELEGAVYSEPLQGPELNNFTEAFGIYSVPSELILGSRCSQLSVTRSFGGAWLLDIHLKEVDISEIEQAFPDSNLVVVGGLFASPLRAASVVERDSVLVFLDNKDGGIVRINTQCKSREREVSREAASAIYRTFDRRTEFPPWSLTKGLR